ncbi:MAG: hypothetical protein OQK58_13430 [Gammaproteobacteria bacterium]|nr:hypothetical protein [Gammaproteobacteria bacterium]
MSLQNSVFKNRNGEFYKVVLPREHNAQLTLKSEYFWNEGSAQQFISHLSVPNGYWRDILHQYSAMPCPSSLSCGEIEKQVSTLLLQGQIKFYPIDVPDVSERPPENRVIKGSDDVLYRFEPISTLLLSKDAKTEKFKNTKEVKAFISNLNSDDKKLLLIANDLKIKLPNSASLNKEEITDSIANAIISGEIVIIADKISSPPADTSKTEEAKGTVGNRRADNVVPPVDEFKEINIDLIDEFDKSAAAFYKLFDDLEFTLKTDQGNEYKGKISDGKIHIPKAKMNSNFELEIKDLPAFMES